MGLLGILVGLGLLVWLAFRGWSVLLLAPAAPLVAALFGGEPLLANWTQVFMGIAARFLAQFFPLFLLGAVDQPIMHRPRRRHVKLHQGRSQLGGAERLTATGRRP